MAVSTSFHMRDSNHFPLTFKVSKGGENND
jgi:hypothetical protein